MEVIVFRHNGDVLLMLDKSSVDLEKHPEQIGKLLQFKLETEYRKDWESIGFHEDGQLYINFPEYEWNGDNSSIHVIGKTYRVQDMMDTVFSIV